MSEICVICQDTDTTQLLMFQPCSAQGNIRHLVCGPCAIKLFSTFKTSGKDVQCPVCRTTVNALQPTGGGDTTFGAYFDTQLVSAGIKPTSFTVVFGQYYPLAVLDTATAKEAGWALQTCITSGMGTIYNTHRDYWITDTLLVGVTQKTCDISHKNDLKSCFTLGILTGKSINNRGVYIFCRVARPYTPPTWVCLHKWEAQVFLMPKKDGKLRREFTRAIAHESGRTSYEDFKCDIYSPDMVVVLQEIAAQTNTKISSLKHVISDNEYNK